METEQATNQNVSFYKPDLDIVAAVQQRNGSGFSGALRFIIREWARLSGYDESKPRPVTGYSRKTRRTRKSSTPLTEIEGVHKGVTA